MEKFNTNKFNTELLNRPFSSSTADKDCKSQKDNISEQLNISNDKTSIASKKRKPFENKLSFKEGNTQLDKDESFCQSGSFTATQMSGLTALSQQEKTIIKDLSKQLNSEILNKAKLCNSQFDSEMPYWIKLFSDIEKTNDIEIPSHSSYFKATDKNKYIGNLVDLCKKDAELYEANLKYNKIRNENKTNIKSLLITGLNAKDEEEDTGNISKTSFKYSNKENTGVTNNTENINSTNEKLANILIHYEKVEKKENKLKNRLGSYNDFKAKSMDTLHKKKKERDMDAGQTYLNKYAYPKIETINEKEVQCYMTIDDFDFEDDDFSELHYRGIMEGDGFKELLEIDKKLHKLDPTRYNTSINTELKKIKRELAETREDRMKETEKKYKKKIDMVKSKETKQRAVFDTNRDNSEKTKHKDYLQDIKKEKKEKELLDNIDNRIRLLPAAEVDEERRLAIIKEVDDMLKSNEEKYRQEMSRKIPEEVNCLRMESMFNEIQEMTLKNKKLLNEYSEQLEKEAQDDESLKKKNEEEDEAMRLVREDCDRFIGKARLEEAGNKELMVKIDEVYERIINEEDSMKEIETRMNRITEESSKYDKLFKEYEDLIELEDEEEKSDQCDQGAQDKDGCEIVSSDNLNQNIIANKEIL
jgi:hypothetical protein